MTARARGFAALSPEARREAARRGGLAAHASGRAHEFTRDEARAAGRKGGARVSADREHMAEIGRKGGLSWAEKRAMVALVEDESAPPTDRQPRLPGVDG